MSVGALRNIAFNIVNTPVLRPIPSARARIATAEIKGARRAERTA